MDRESVDGDQRWEGASDFNPTFFVFKYRFQTPLMRTDVDEGVKQGVGGESYLSPQSRKWRGGPSSTSAKI